MVAAYLGKTEIVRILLIKGADVNAKDKDGKTALSGAAFYGHADIAELLINKDADVITPAIKHSNQAA